MFGFIVSAAFNAIEMETYNFHARLHGRFIHAIDFAVCMRAHAHSSYQAKIASMKNRGAAHS